jgi:tetratricopeptide (TPR) repeat protein
MRPLFSGSAIRTLSVAFTIILAAATSSPAQMNPAQPQSMGTTNAMQNQLHLLTDVQTQTDPKQEAAYKQFFKANEPAKKIHLGTDFLERYPKSPYAEPVDVGLMDVYYNEHDWKDVYAYADSALALKPDDVDVLTTVGWLIPHIYHPDDADADQQLDKAETYAKHAIEVIPTMPKPPDVTDAEFATLKAQKLVQAHSALGLVYFRRADYGNSAKELQMSTPSTANPDATDLYVLGVDLENLNRLADAADVYSRCGQIAGPLQDRCKQSADAAKKQIPQSK